MENNQIHHELSLTCSQGTVLRDIVDERMKIPQGENVHVDLELIISLDLRLSEIEKKAILELMDDYGCNSIELSDYTDDIHPNVKDVIAKAINKTLDLTLLGYISDAAFRYIHELIIANGGIQELTFLSLQLSNVSWELFNSHKLGNRDENSIMYILLNPEMPDGRFAQFIQKVSGFKHLMISGALSSFPETFRGVGQVLSKHDCELSTLTITIYNEDCSDGDFLKNLMETFTTNCSVSDLRIHFENHSWTDNVLTSVVENLHKFNQLSYLWICVNRDLPSLDFLRPLLINACKFKKPPLEVLKLDLVAKKKYSEAENSLLLKIAQSYQTLRSFGEDIVLTPALRHIVRMNGWWRQSMTTAPQLPLSLWGLVLADVEKSYNSQEKQEEKEVADGKDEEKNHNDDHDNDNDDDDTDNDSHKNDDGDDDGDDGGYQEEEEEEDEVHEGEDDEDEVDEGENDEDEVHEEENDEDEVQEEEDDEDEVHEEEDDEDEVHGEEDDEDEVHEEEDEEDEVHEEEDDEDEVHEENDDNAAVVASIRFELIHYLIGHHTSNFI